MTNRFITAVQALAKFRERPLYRKTCCEKIKRREYFGRGQIIIQTRVNGIG
jgi:hypothetical protein